MYSCLSYPASKAHELVCVVIGWLSGSIIFVYTISETVQVSECFEYEKCVLRDGVSASVNINAETVLV